MPTVSLASPDDNDDLLDLCRRTPMPGDFSLRIDREPDFFRLTRLRGESTVLVAREGTTIVGCVTLSRSLFRIGGEPTPVTYVGDLKVAPESRRTGVAKLLLDESLRVGLDRGDDLVACVVSRGNHRTLDFLDGRAGAPRFVSLGGFDVFQALSARRSVASAYVLSEAEPEDVPALTRLYDAWCARYELAPALGVSDWHDRVGGRLPGLRVFVARQGGDLCAALSVFDTVPYKQHVIVGVPRPVRWASAVMRPLRVVSPAFHIPREGERVPLLFLSHLAIEPGHEPGLRALVQLARNRAWGLQIPFIVYGVHERDPLRELFRGLPKFTFPSEAFLTSLRGRRHLVDRVRAGVPMEDYALT